MIKACYDKKLIPILPGDIVKVFEYYHPHNGRIYDHMQCTGFESFTGTGDRQFLFFRPLEAGRSDGPHYEPVIDQVLGRYEIVQSWDGTHKERTRKESGE